MVALPARLIGLEAPEMFRDLLFRRAWRLRTIAACAVTMMTAACASHSQNAQRLLTAPVIDNAEDLALLPGGEWVIASSMAGGKKTHGELMLVSTKTGAVERLDINQTAEQNAVDTHCSAPVAPERFMPHGIALVSGPNDALRLYVVNHGVRESVEIFDVSMSGEKPSLAWAGCLQLPEGGAGNGIAASREGSVFVANMGQPPNPEKPSTPMDGHVLRWDREGGWSRIAQSAMIIPNGILVSPDGDQIYVAAYITGKLVRIDLRPGRNRWTEMQLSFLPDNLRWSGKGTILVTGHLDEPQNVQDCYLSANTVCATPSTIAEIDPVTLETVRTFPVSIGLGTVAIEVGDELWIGTARGPTIERLAKPARD